MQVIPAVDVLGDHAVRLERGDFSRVIFSQPLESFIERLVATQPGLIHVVDLQGARDGAIRIELIQRCLRAAQGVPLQVSGGLRTVDAALEVLDAGAARVVVGTALWRDGALQAFATALGERMVAALDVRDGSLAVGGWAVPTAIGLDDAIEQCQRANVRRLHVTAIERDGMFSGPNLALYERACTSAIPVVAAGGVRGEGDLADLARIGCEAAVMGVGYLSRLATE